MRKILILTVSLFPLASIAGCQQYLTRSDFISPHTGDAIARNNSNQTVDPWNPYVYDRDIETSGSRQAEAYETYSSPNSQAATTAAAPTTH